jgi:signal transduction histidine kinase
VSDKSEFEHELKNYLAIILGYTDLLIDEMPGDDPRLEDLNEIHKAATAAVALLNSHGGTTP